jgi:hypothetical protein
MGDTGSRDGFVVTADDLSQDVDVAGAARLVKQYRDRAFLPECGPGLVRDCVMHGADCLTEIDLHRIARAAGRRRQGAHRAFVVQQGDLVVTLAERSGLRYGADDLATVVDAGSAVDAARSAQRA